jgi:hypothetical protein
VHTEHGAFFDGHADPKQRELGSLETLEALATDFDPLPRRRPPAK